MSPFFVSLLNLLPWSLIALIIIMNKIDESLLQNSILMYTLKVQYVRIDHL